MENVSKNNKLQAKDLIQVGIFSAIYIIVTMAVSIPLGMIPFLYPVLIVVTPMIAGIPFMLFLTRVKKFGMVWILATLFGLFLMLTGHSIWTLPVYIVVGLLCELLLKSGKYSSVKKSILTCGIFSTASFSIYLLFFLTRDSYFEMIASHYGQEYADILMRFVPEWSLIPIVFASFLGGILGGLLGRGVLKKHFEKAGIA